MKYWLLLLLLFSLAACNAASNTQPTINPQRPAATETQAISQPLGSDIHLDQEATQLMRQLTNNNEVDFLEATEAILAANDTRFIAVFIEILRANQLGLLPNTTALAYIDALETLSGQNFGGDWAAWVEWYGAEELTPPPGFTGWKGQLLGQIDPGFADFLQDDFSTTVRTEEILWGGVMVDGIPALDNATMIPATEADYLEPDEPVFGISINGDHRAYPLRILDWHEMANDVVGGVPVSLAYCTLCGAGIAYDGRASNGETYTFGSSGFLFRSNKLMYDRQTRTLWNQLTGEPVLGELVETDIKLSLLPVVVTTWESWQAQHADTLVLDLDTGYQRPYIPGAAYGDYFAYDDTMFPVWQRNELLFAKDRIYALQVNGIPKAYPVDLLAKEIVVNDTIGDTAIVIIAARGNITVAGQNQRIGQVSYDAGGEVRTYERADRTFTAGPDPNTILDSDGHPWLVSEEALIGPDGEQAPRINGHLAYWFGWFSFFPKTLIYEKP